MSLDVAIGAMVFAASLAQFYGQSLPFAVLFCLFSAVWLIYTFDHLLDAIKKGSDPSMIRHQFHLRYRWGISAIMVLVFILGLSSLLFIPVITLIYGGVVTFIVLIYFLLSYKLKIFLIKEVLIASVYATGIMLGPVSLIEIPVQEIICLLIQIFGIALINLLLLSYYEIEFDKKDGQHSWAVRFGKEKTQRHISTVIPVLLGIQMISIYWMIDQLLLQAVLIAMTLVLCLISYRQAYFGLNERYRTFSDLIFFMPGIIFWL